MIKIAVIGIAGESVFLSVDKFAKIGETAVATDYHAELGGKGFNQAVAAARCGARVSFLCAAHKEDVDKFKKIALSVGVKPFFVGKEECSPYAVIITDKSGDNSVTVYHGAELSAADVECFYDEIKSADILLINNEVPHAVNERAVEIAKKFGVKIILNPAPYRETKKDFLNKIDLFTPNEHETKGLEEYDNVIITQGKDGAFIKSLGELVPAVKIKKAIDTTGAGDTFSGVLAFYIASGKDLKEACEKASVAAAIKVGKRYILDAIPTIEQIENYNV
ncbi:MAG: ribokinase [Clostridia bacterium]|nr:ribokinase [Clostridia bacterium]